MNPTYFSLFDMAICGIPALGFGAWQLISVNREIAKDARKKTLAAKAALPDDAGPPVGEHRLHDR
jgi:hypothetical protein